MYEDSYEMGVRDAVSARISVETCPICGDEMRGECDNCGYEFGMDADR
jgi:hypothetical protein